MAWSCSWAKLLTVILSKVICFAKSTSVPVIIKYVFAPIDVKFSNSQFVKLTIVSVNVAVYYVITCFFFAFRF